MSYLTKSFLRFKNVLFIAGAMLCSLCTYAQSDPSHSFLNIAAVADEEESVVQEEAPLPEEAEATKTIVLKANHIYKYIFLDFGTGDLNYNVGGKTYGAHGPTIAFSGQLAYKIRSAYDYRRMFISAGLELRHFAPAFTLVDPRLSITQDYLRFWYAGVPIMFQYVNTKHTGTNKNDINCYFQGGVSLGYKVMMSFSREDGNETIEDNTKNYSNYLVQPFLSAGISYTTQRKVCLIGPFVAFSTNNISTIPNFNANFTSYGIRLSALMFR